MDAPTLATQGQVASEFGLSHAHLKSAIRRVKTDLPGKLTPGDIDELSMVERILDRAITKVNA